MNRRETLAAGLVVFVGVAATLVGNQEGAKTPAARAAKKLTFGPVLLGAKLMEPAEEADRPCWMLALTVENPTKKTREVVLPVTLTRTVSDPGARAMPPPKVIKRKTWRVTVAAGGTKTVKIALPEGVRPRPGTEHARSSVAPRVTYSFLLALGEGKFTTLFQLDASETPAPGTE